MHYRLAAASLSQQQTRQPYSLTNMTRPQKLKVALAGLGGIGKRHALNLLNLAAKVEFVAAFSTAPAELGWAKEHLEPHQVLMYDEYEQMLYHPGIQAVIIATAAAAHKPQILRAIDLDLHVMCEKPLSPDLASVGASSAFLQQAYWLDRRTNNVRVVLRDS